MQDMYSVTYNNNLYTIGDIWRANSTIEYYGEIVGFNQENKPLILIDGNIRVLENHNWIKVKD